MSSATSIRPLRSSPSTLLEVVSSRSFSEETFRLVRSVGDAEGDDDVLRALSRCSAFFGADLAVFASFIRDDRSGESFRFVVAADPRWCTEYQSHGWYGHDAWLLYAANNTLPTTDTHIALNTAGQRAARDLAARFGASSAYLVPAQSPAGVSRLGVLALGSRVPGYFDGPGQSELRVPARSLALELHEWSIRQSRRELLSRHRISDEDLELLRLERDGLSSKAIAASLNVTATSIDSKFQRLNGKLGTATRKASARLAVAYGLL